MSVGTPISEMGCLLIFLFTCLWHADGHGPRPSRSVDVGAAASEGGIKPPFPDESPASV
jgi:hypothetical protein